MRNRNLDRATVDGFGDEWVRFDQSSFSASDRDAVFADYFSIFPWDDLPTAPVGFDVGCGSGRWAQVVAQRVERLHCIDPSAALSVAKKNLSHLSNCEFHEADANSLPLQDSSMDFGYSLGVLHHIPDSLAALRACVKKLKPGAPFLLYIYYSFDNRPGWYRLIWRLSETLRYVISRVPFGLRYWLSQLIAVFIYFPLARAAWCLGSMGFNVDNFPLSAYRNRGFYTMRTDALDRFGTQLEKRFSKTEIAEMMECAGLENVVFSEAAPFWCAVGRRRMEDC